MADSILGQLLSAFGGPWIDRAKDQTAQDIAAYQRGGVLGLLQDTHGGQDLAGGFGGNTKAVGSPLQAAVRIGERTFTGPNHVLAMDAAEKALGRGPVQDAMIAESQALRKRFEAGENITGGGMFNGFVTPDGRYLSRAEANQYVQNPRGFARAEDLQ